MIISKKNLQGITLGVLAMGTLLFSGHAAEAAASDHQWHKNSQCYSAWAPMTGYEGMTSAQKAEIEARHEQMLAWHKKDLQAAVAAGKITQQEADARIERIHTMFVNMQKGNPPCDFDYSESGGPRIR